MDTVTPEKRSEIMSRVRSKNTGPERVVRAALAGKRLAGFECHADDLPGKPDFVFRGSRLAIFVEGCFWHGCPKHYKKPKSNKAFWAKKVKDNTARDEKNELMLRVQGWHVLRFWECDVRRNLHGVMSIIVNSF